MILKTQGNPKKQKAINRDYSSKDRHKGAERIIGGSKGQKYEVPGHMVGPSDENKTS
jgi:hypothetical protein